MKSENILEELERAAEKVGVRISYEVLGADTVGQGGLCKVKGEWRVIVDRHASSSEKVALVARALSRFDLDAVYLAPEVREMMGRLAPPKEIGPS